MNIIKVTMNAIFVGVLIAVASIILFGCDNVGADLYVIDDTTQQKG